MAQYLRPASDITLGSPAWVNESGSSTALFASLDEVAYSDADYVQSSLNTNNSYETGLSGVSGVIPGAHTIRWRASRYRTNKSLTLTMGLYQGSTLIASQAQSDASLNTLTTFAYTLTAGEIASISDYSALSLRFTVSNNGGAGQYALVSWAEFEVPDATLSDNLASQAISAGVPTVDSGTIAQAHSLTSAVVSVTPLVNQAVLEQVHALAAPDSSVGAPFVEMSTLSQVYGLSTLSVATHIPAVTQAVIGQDHALQGSVIETGVPDLGSSALAQGHALTGQTLQGGSPVLGVASLLTPVDLTARDILAAPVLMPPGISQVQVLESLSLTSGSPVMVAAAIAEIHNLRGSAIVADFPTSETPALGPHHLLAKDIAATPGVQMASMGALYSRAGDYILSGQYMGVAGTPLLYFPLVANPPDALSATDVQPRVPVVDKPSLVVVAVLQGVEIVSGSPLCEQPAIGQDQRLAVQPILSGAPIIETANLEILAHTLNSKDLDAGTAAIEAATIRQDHHLDCAGVAPSAPTLAQPALSESVFALAAAHVSPGIPVIEEAVLAESIIALEARDIETGLPVVEEPAFLQIQTLGADDLLMGLPDIGINTLSQVHELALDAIFLEPSVEKPGFTENVDQLTPAEISTGAASIDLAAVRQTHELGSIETITDAVVLQPPSITQAIHALTPTDVHLGIPVVTQTAISQAHALSAYDITTVLHCGEPTLSQDHALAGMDAVTSFSVEQTALYQEHGLISASLSANGVIVEEASLVGVVGINASDLAAGVPMVDQGELLIISHFGAVDIASGVPEIEPISIEVILGNPWYYYAQL